MRRASACRIRHRLEHRCPPSSERARPRPRPIASAPAALLPRAPSFASTTFRGGRQAGEDYRHAWSEFAQCFVASLNTSTTLSLPLEPAAFETIVPMCGELVARLAFLLSLLRLIKLNCVFVKNIRRLFFSQCLQNQRVIVVFIRPRRAGGRQVGAEHERPWVRRIEVGQGRADIEVHSSKAGGLHPHT